MNQVSIRKKGTFIRRMAALMLLVCMMFNINAKSAMAADEKDYYYKGYNITYNGGNGVHIYTKTWRGGFLWLTDYKENYYLTNSYMRCLTYFSDAWIANQNQKLTVSGSKTVTRSVSDGVSSEFGISSVVSIKLGTQYETSVTTSYDVSMELNYDLSKYNHNSYKIAAMGFYDKFKVIKYKNGSYDKTYYAYAYDANFGQEIRLVYRY